MLLNTSARSPSSSPCRTCSGSPKSESLQVLHAVVEPHLAEQGPGYRCQFERTGYFYRDPEDADTGLPVFNRIITLRDTWAKLEAGG